MLITSQKSWDIFIDREEAKDATFVLFKCVVIDSTERIYIRYVPASVCCIKVRGISKVICNDGSNKSIIAENKAVLEVSNALVTGYQQAIIRAIKNVKATAYNSSYVISHHWYENYIHANDDSTVESEGLDSIDARGRCSITAGKAISSRVTVMVHDNRVSTTCCKNNTRVRYAAECKVK
jgi:hypothetical protein